MIYDDTIEQFITIDAIPVGTFFMRAKNASKVYKRGAYNRSTKRYDAIAHNKGESMELKGCTLVYTGFEY